MDAPINHTRELEQRLRAIRVGCGDTCIFYKRRDGCLFPQKQCCYCAFAEFKEDDLSGFCRFKK